MCKQNDSKPITLNEFKFSPFPYNKHLINRAKSVCTGESWPRLRVQTERSEVCTQDGQDSPIHPAPRWPNTVDHFIYSKPTLSALFFSIIERNVLMALVCYYKDMLGKVTTQRTQ